MFIDNWTLFFLLLLAGWFADVCWKQGYSAGKREGEHAGRASERQLVHEEYAEREEIRRIYGGQQ